MVPQAIPLRRCRYCLVLVGDQGPPREGAGASWRLPDLPRLLWPPPSRKASQMEAPAS